MFSNFLAQRTFKCIFLVVFAISKNPSLRYGEAYSHVYKEHRRPMYNHIQPINESKHMHASLITMESS